MKDSSWHEISRFESNDLVKIWYEKTHGKSPPADKISQINAFFKQGREYFNNAAGADMSVKPLLLYYGVLSLSRGTVLLLDISKKEESLKKKHGLEVVDWGHTLSGGIKNVLELKIKATDGTFRELVDVCPNIHNEQCFYFPTKTKVVVDHDLGPIKFASDGGLLSLDDLLHELLELVDSEFCFCSANAALPAYANCFRLSGDYRKEVEMVSCRGHSAFNRDPLCSDFPSRTT